MREGIRIGVSGEHAGERLDRFLRNALPDLPAKSIRFAVEAGEVLVGSRPARKGRILEPGEEVEVRRVAEREDWMPVPCDLPGAAVLFSDDSVTVLGKPADIHTEPQRPCEAGTLAGYLRWKFPGTARVSTEPGLTLLTRLDYATSGAVPAALTAQAYDYLVREREQGRILKTYHCLVRGRVEREMSLTGRLETGGGERVRVRSDLEETDPDRWTMASPVRVYGGFTLLRATISRGKRHQIRAHLAAAGFPIVGDRRYSAVPEEGPGRVRLMLHASEVVFSHPERKEPLRVVCPLPDGFEVS